MVSIYMRDDDYAKIILRIIDGVPTRYAIFGTNVQMMELSGRSIAFCSCKFNIAFDGVHDVYQESELIHSFCRCGRWKCGRGCCLSYFMLRR